MRDSAPLYAAHGQGIVLIVTAVTAATGRGGLGLPRWAAAGTALAQPMPLRLPLTRMAKPA